MTRRSLGVLALLTGLWCLTCGPIANAGGKGKEDVAVATTSPGTVIGRVYDAGTGIPIEGCQVVVQQEGAFAKEGKSVGKTSEQGRYECIAALGRGSTSYNVAGLLFGGSLLGRLVGPGTTKTQRIDVTQLNLRVSKPGYHPFEGVVRCRTTNTERFNVVMEPILLTPVSASEVSTAADGWGALRMLDMTVTPSVLRPKEKAQVMVRLQAPAAAAIKQKQSFLDSLFGRKAKEQLRVGVYSKLPSRSWGAPSTSAVLGALLLGISPLPSPYRELKLTSKEEGMVVFSGEFTAPKSVASPSAWLYAIVTESPVEIVAGAAVKRALVQIVPQGQNQSVARLRLEAAGLEEAGETAQAQAKLQEVCGSPEATIDDCLWLASMSERLHDATTRATAARQAWSLVPSKGKSVVVRGEEMKLEPARWQVLGAYAAALLDNAQAAEAIREVAPAVDKVKEKERPKKIPGDVAVTLAAAYLESGRLAEAEALNDKLGEWPGAVSTDQAKRFREKLRLAQVEKATRERPESGQAWADYGRALMDQGQWEEAVVKLQTALEKAPSSPAVRRDLTYAVTHLYRSPAAAEVDLEAALAAAEKQVGLGKGSTPSKDFFDWHMYAMLLYRKAYLQRQADDPAAAATLQRSREMMVEAIKCGRAGAEVRETSDKSIRSINIEGFAYPEAANDFMILDCLDILAEHPKDYLAWYTVANALLDMRQTEVAEEALQQCLKLQPDLPEAKYAQALLALQQDNREQSKELLREVLTANPRHPRANRMLAQLYMEEGDMVSSAACLAAHVELYGDVE